MPSANMSEFEIYRNEPSLKEHVANPLQNALTVVEHKIRNLEKRKAKLDQYKSEQDQGRQLNQDQLKAVSKYNDVVQQLEVCRELMKQISVANKETKKHLKREYQAHVDSRLTLVSSAFEYQQYLFEVFRDTQSFAETLDNVNMLQKTGAPTGFMYDLFNCIASLSNEMPPQSPTRLRLCLADSLNTYWKPTYKDFDLMAKEWIKILDYSKEHLPYYNFEQYTYSDIKDALDYLMLDGSREKVNYNYNLRYECRQSLLLQNGSEKYSMNQWIKPEEWHQRAESSFKYDQPKYNHKPPTDDDENSCLHHVSSSPEKLSEEFTEKVALSNTNAFPESQFSFWQDSQIDLESPHNDPAVVAVSSKVPPKISSPNGVENYDVSSSANGNPNGMIDNSGAMNGSTLKDSPTPMMDKEINEWTNSTANDSQDAEASSLASKPNFNASGQKGNWRGRARGRFNNSRGFQRGGRGGGFHHHQRPKPNYKPEEGGNEVRGVTRARGRGRGRSNFLSNNFNSRNGFGNRGPSERNKRTRPSENNDL